LTVMLEMCRALRWVWLCGVVVWWCGSLVVW
jgi:hypothetical protein